MTSPIQLIVGLGNPGAKYESTRHNAGFWFVDELARRHGGALRSENKFHGEVGRISIAGQDVWLLKPMIYMNRSGQSVAAIAHFYKISVEAVLVAHDELDLPPGGVKLKQGGGHAGHNGLRDICAQLGRDFLRLRIGIGHPGHASEVTGYVLGKPSPEERGLMERAIDECVDTVPDIVAGELQKAMHRLHTSGG
ncbi:aminoacyl-tRNA hydrolase [Thiohalomonas denitrificans]|uniref:aminoacyl-tRNA hydrolase n=1 Tax=Thiohalomonas denitrificans TaxID=415747 RepID=UPI0026EF6A3F|nr:aminoacyl-tRNA hydrolase [Thiohalomonas denitrificans]